MGSLHHFNLAGIAKLHGLKHFVETGTAQGDSLALASGVPAFKTLHSIEIVESLATAARARFALDSRVNIWHGDSVELAGQVPDGVNCIINCSSAMLGCTVAALSTHESSIAMAVPFKRENTG